MHSKLILALALTAVAGVAQAKIPKNIQLAPYCDQLTDLTPNGAGGVSGVWAEATPCGVGADVAAGGVTGKVLAGTPSKGYVLNSDSYPTYGGYYSFIVNADTTWYLVGMDGSILTGGNWTPALAPGLATGKPLMAK